MQRMLNKYIETVYKSYEKHLRKVSAFAFLKSPSLKVRIQVSFHNPAHYAHIAKSGKAEDCKGCTLGTTMTIVDKAVPNVVGVDIGCGMYTVNLGKVDINFAKVDEVCHFIPSGRNVWEAKEQKVQFQFRILSKRKCLRL